MRSSEINDLELRSKSREIRHKTDIWIEQGYQNRQYDESLFVKELESFLSKFRLSKKNEKTSSKA